MRKLLHPHCPSPLSVGARVGAFRDLMICLGWLRLFRSIVGAQRRAERHRPSRRRRERWKTCPPRG